MSGLLPVTSVTPNVHTSPRNPWLSKHVLTFDGGGVRGYFSLLLVQILMQYIAIEEGNRARNDRDSLSHMSIEEEPVSSFSPCKEPSNLSHRSDKSYTPFLPCHYFDYIGGTSTGGLIATMLGRLRMTVEDCIDEYTNLAGDVFGHPRHLHDLNTYGLIKRCKYDTERLEQVIKDVIVRRVENGRDDHPNVRFETEPGMSRVLVVANRIASEGVVTNIRLFRSYDVDYRQKLDNQPSHLSFASMFRSDYGGRSGDLSIWQVARATTAAPMYFEPLEILTDENLTYAGTNSRLGSHDGTGKPRYERLEDGGLGYANNPSKVMYDELTEQLSNNMSIGTFVSIGTARPMDPPTGSRLFRVIKGSISRLGNPEHTHEQMMSLAARDDSLRYYRLNQPGGLAGIQIDDWNPKPTGEDTMNTMKTAFNAYISTPEIVTYMQQCARDLVAARRARVEANLPRWKRFATGRYFYCKMPNCPDDEVHREVDEASFIAHLKEGHQMTDDAIYAALKICEDQWRYRGQ
ncbi:hypothetical protein M426DRAFT_21595 [Hypoxylon sp. CI-4A]|nr:hypothetical protein M426DRAFT_21595 [Hypoxylon sp. CI-4A]